jgi:hypothetical protein
LLCYCLKRYRNQLPNPKQFLRLWGCGIFFVGATHVAVGILLHATASSRRQQPEIGHAEAMRMQCVVAMLVAGRPVEPVEASSGLRGSSAHVCVFGGLGLDFFRLSDPEDVVASY